MYVWYQFNDAVNTRCYQRSVSPTIVATLPLLKTLEEGATMKSRTAKQPDSNKCRDHKRNIKQADLYFVRSRINFIDIR
jgi:hypothetical protein